VFALYSPWVPWNHESWKDPLIRSQLPHPTKYTRSEGSDGRVLHVDAYLGVHAPPFPLLGTTEMRLIFKLSAKMRWAVPYDSPTITQTSCIVCLRSARIASRTFLYFPVLCLSTVVQNAHRRRQTFVRPWSVCTINKFCYGSWHYLRMLPVAHCGFLQQFFFKDWNKIWCRFFAPYSRSYQL